MGKGKGSNRWMSLTSCEDQNFQGETIELSGRAFRRCRFVECTLVIRDGPFQIENCSFERCNWRMDRLLRWDRPESERDIIAAIDLARSSTGKPPLLTAAAMYAHRQVNPFATHLPVLMACVAATTGPVLELGCGHYSTPILNQMCRHRKVVSVESDAQWMAQFLDLQGENHQFMATDWTNLELPDLRWGVVFVDHAPAERRVVDIAQLMNKAELLVVHDTEAPLYGYEAILPTFKYRYDYQRVKPWTTVVSQSTPLDFLHSA
jgi:hypothetical protein